MTKASDYVNDYQLNSACKDAICIAPSKVTQMIFAVLEDWYRHIILTHSFKLVSFFTDYIFKWTGLLGATYLEWWNLLIFFFILTHVAFVLFPR